MDLPRVVPCLLLHQGGLYKTKRFRDPSYVGDPINVARIFNDKEVDDLVLLDIDATVNQTPIDFSAISEIAGECFMPVAYGGGIRTVSDCHALFAQGVDKVIINSAAVANPSLIAESAATFGSQSVAVAIDAARRGDTYTVRISGGRVDTGLPVVTHAQAMVEAGAGELLITSIDREGMGTSYDQELVRAVSGAVRVPVIANGGASTLADCVSVIRNAGAAAAAAGSMFVFHGRHRAVLVTYPSYADRQRAFALEPSASE